MWIKLQEDDILIKIDNVALIDEGLQTILPEKNGAQSTFILAEYETKERSQEIFNQIQKAIFNGDTLFKIPKD